MTFESEWDRDEIDNFEDIFKEFLESLGNPSMDWHVDGKNLGWRNLSGEMDTHVENFDDLVSNVLPKTNDFMLKIYKRNKAIYGIGFIVVCYHHDSPTGETYTFTPKD